MKAAFYKTLIRLTKILGPWFFILVAQGIASGYFIIDGRRRSISRRFYSVVYPARSAAYHFYIAWKQFVSFTYVFLDRYIQREVRDLDCRIQGRHHIAAAHADQKGGILLMSHMGNWEMAAHLLTRVLPDLNLLLYMGIRQKEEIEKIQKQSISKDGIRVVGIDQESGSPLDIIEGVRFLQNGGLVSMAGDIVWREDQPTVTGIFMQRQVRIPQAPFVLSLVTCTPLIVFFAFRTDSGGYHFKALPPIRVEASKRENRDAAIRHAAQQYLQHLEAAVREHPCQWYHFEDFFQA